MKKELEKWLKNIYIKGNTIIKDVDIIEAAGIKEYPEIFKLNESNDEDLIGTWGWTWLLKNFAIVQVEERKDVALDFRRSNMADKNSIKADKTNNNWVTEEELDIVKRARNHKNKSCQKIMK